MNFNDNNKEFEGLRFYIIAHIRKLNMEQLQNVVKYLMEKGYNFQSKTALKLPKECQYEPLPVPPDDPNGVMKKGL